MLTDGKITELASNDDFWFSVAGFSHEFLWLEFARAIEAEVRKEQADQIAELEQRAELAEQELVGAVEERDHIRPLLAKVKDLERQLAEAKKDAERIEELEVLAARWTRLVNGLGDVLTGEGMDKTVDAAIKAKEQP